MRIVKTTNNMMINYRDIAINTFVSNNIAYRLSNVTIVDDVLLIVCVVNMTVANKSC